MLDTRYILPFVDPQIGVNMANKFQHILPFSDWNADSKNFVITRLLKDHIHNILNDKENFKKLRKTMFKIGFKPGIKLLILDSEHAHFILFETMPDGELNIFSGILKEKLEMNVNCVVKFLYDDFDGIGDDWLETSPLVLPNRAKHLEKDKPFIDRIYAGILSMSAFFVYLLFVEVSIKVIQPKEKFKPVKFEGFKNQQKIPILVADLGWSTETIMNVPYGVSGHLRSQPCGPGNLDRKLICIEPYIKYSYNKKSGKDRILKQP